MDYMILLNTIAFLVLMVTVMLYIDTSHKLNGCKYDRNQMFCFTDLHCAIEVNSNN